MWQLINLIYSTSDPYGTCARTITFNHSMRAGSVTFASPRGVKERELAQQGRCKSDKGMRTYIQPTLEQRRALSRALQEGMKELSKKEGHKKKHKSRSRKHKHSCVFRHLRARGDASGAHVKGRKGGGFPTRETPTKALRPL